MNCQKFEDVVGELVQEQMMQGTVRNDVMLHAENCATCKNRLREEELLTQALSGLAAEMNPISASPALESKLREAFSAREQIVVLPPATNYRRYWLTAVAAVLLIAFALVSLSWNRRQHLSLPVVANNAENVKPPTIKPEIVTPITEITSKGSSVDDGSASLKVEKRRLVGRSQMLAQNSMSAQNSRVNRKTSSSVNQQSMVASNTTREIATEFLPLAAMNAASLQDGGKIVRVELPRSALASFGLPVNMDRYNERVKADLVVGVDGLAHAIRFVQ